MNSTWRSKSLTILSIAALVAIWALSAGLWGQDILLPSPVATAARLAGILEDPAAWLALWMTVVRTLFGFGLALVTALVLGMLAGFFRPAYYFLQPAVTVIKAMPTISIILLALLWLGQAQTPILVGFLIVFPILYSSVVEGIRGVDQQLLEMARVYRVKPLTVVSDVYLPAIMSYLAAGMRAALGLNLKVIIAAEVLSQTPTSVGGRMVLRKFYLDTAGVFAWTVVAVITAAVLELTLRLIPRLYSLIKSHRQQRERDDCV